MLNNLYLLRHHYEELHTAEQYNDDVDTVKYAKKRRMQEDSFEGASEHKRRGGSHAAVYGYFVFISSLFQSTPASTVFSLTHH